MAMEQKHKSATEAFLQYLDVWGRREKNSLAVIRSYHHEKITAIGSAKHDIFHGLEEMDEQWKKEVDQITTETFEINWVDEIELNDTTFIVNCELEWIRALKRNANVRVLHRVTTVWIKKEGKYKLGCWHSSAPDGAGHHEIFPGSDEPRYYPEISVLFSDFVGFTQLASSLSAKDLVKELNELFTIMDITTKKYGLIKIKTIGDGYMLAGGLGDERINHAKKCAQWALEIMAYLKDHNADSSIQWEIRVGIHSGPVIGGIIGQEKPTFDLWGDTVNTASRIESSGKAGKVNISKVTYELLKDDPLFKFQNRGKVVAKGKGEIEMYFLDSNSDT